MNFTETFEQFSNRTSPLDLALYAGVALVLWVMFGNKLGGIKEFVNSIIGKIKSPTPILNSKIVNDYNDDQFFQLVASWKKTRDLANAVGCSEAVKVADQMFPYLSPQVCKEENKNVK